jgi:hypothetical protein
VLLWLPLLLQDDPAPRERRDHLPRLRRILVQAPLPRRLQHGGQVGDQGANVVRGRHDHGPCLALLAPADLELEFLALAACLLQHRLALVLVLVGVARVAEQVGDSAVAGVAPAFQVVQLRRVGTLEPLGLGAAGGDHGLDEGHITPHQVSQLHARGPQGQRPGEVRVERPMVVGEDLAFRAAHVVALAATDGQRPVVLRADEQAVE